MKKEKKQFPEKQMSKVFINYGKPSTKNKHHLYWLILERIKLFTRFISLIYGAALLHSLHYSIYTIHIRPYICFIYFDKHYNVYTCCVYVHIALASVPIDKHQPWTEQHETDCVGQRFILSISTTSTYIIEILFTLIWVFFPVFP